MGKQPSGSAVEQRTQPFGAGPAHAVKPACHSEAHPCDVITRARRRPSTKSLSGCRFVRFVKRTKQNYKSRCHLSKPHSPVFRNGTFWTECPARSSSLM